MNHVATITIIRQINLTTSFTDKLNLCLIQAAAYIQQFQLKIHHKFEKQNIVSDTLSRLSCQEAEAEANEKSILDIFFTESTLDILFIKFIYIFHILIIEVSDKFKISLREDYEHDAQ